MTARQIRFCEEYIKSRNPQKASLAVGYSASFSKTKSYQLIKNTAIKDKISTLEDRYYKEEFQKLALEAVSTLKDVLSNELSPSSQLQAIKYILHEAGLAEQDDKQSGTISIKVTLPKELE